MPGPSSSTLLVCVISRRLQAACFLSSRYLHSPRLLHFCASWLLEAKVPWDVQRALRCSEISTPIHPGCSDVRACSVPVRPDLELGTYPSTANGYKNGPRAFLMTARRTHHGSVTAISTIPIDAPIGRLAVAVWLVCGLSPAFEALRENAWSCCRSRLQGARCLWPNSISPCRHTSEVYVGEGNVILTWPPPHSAEQ